MTGAGGWGVAPVFGATAIRAALCPDAVIAAVRTGLIDHARGQMVSPPPGQLLFTAPPGDCHVKLGQLRGGAVFAIKVATGFYDNPKLGLPVNNGIVLLLSVTTGEILAILQDEGWLTSWRTAAAGAVAAGAGAPSEVSHLGIVGTGHQAELQAIWGGRALGNVITTVWGRDPGKAESLAARLSAQGVAAEATANLEHLFACCQVVITCTPSVAPFIRAEIVRPGTHIVALGADAPGKVELDPALFARAAGIATDDHEQCLDHGDFGYAVRAGVIRAGIDVSLGAVLAGDATLRVSESDVTIVDLTGIAAQDLAIANLAWMKLRLPREAPQDS